MEFENYDTENFIVKDAPSRQYLENEEYTFEDAIELVDWAKREFDI